MIQVYTGNGKGKTTAALGLALRAVGHGLRVQFIMFMKGDIAYGELESAKKFEPQLVIHPMGRADFVDKDHPAPIDIEWAQKAMALARKIIENRDADILVLDEALVAVDYNLIKESDLMNLLDSASPDMEIVLTGRGASSAVINRADIVTEFAEVKHYYRKGVLSREGYDH